MSYFEEQSDALEDPQAEQAEQTEQTEQAGAAGPRLADFRERVARAFQSFDRGRLGHLIFEPRAQLEPPDSSAEFDPESDSPDAVLAEVPGPSEDSRFPVGPLGYNRAAVDARIAELEQQLGQLREQEQPAISITEEIERLGEQAASILVVAHDQAHETARLAKEQAERCVTDAAANAVSLTEQAKRELRALDDETDAVWRERARLIDDARNVGLALIALAEEAQERFPEEGRTEDVPQVGG